MLYKNIPWVVIEFTSVKPGKGGAYIRTKLRSLIDGAVQEVTFRSGEKIPRPDITTHKMQFLYNDDLYHFMDQENYEQVAFSQKQLGETMNYIKEGEIYDLMLFDGNPIAVEPPIFMVLEVVETVPGVKGDTAQGGSKAAKLETGLVVQVPLFVNEGDKVKVDTRDKSYIERA
ncbi:elongation factor P [Candidatus Babeliales bacterium]|nr:elongation factor P [Candidatus Babeliales bacterium]